MNKNDYLASINAKGIDHKRVEWTTTVKGAAAHAHRALTKRSTAYVMTGASYADLGVNADTQTGPLPWGTWDTFPHIVAHKGKEYARLYTVDGTVKTRYFVDGTEVTQEIFNDFLTPSQRTPKRPNGGCITVTLDNILKVG